MIDSAPGNNINNPDIGSKGRFAIVIPVYNHEEKIADVLIDTLKLDLPVYVVDDGSTDSTYNKIKDIHNITILRHKKNRGKGAALITGFAACGEIADWAITIDADGQHNPADALNLIQALPDDKRPIIVGRREGMIVPSVPWTSRFGREFSNFWVWLSGGGRITDSQSGFRIYPLPEAKALKVRAQRFQFEVEILVKARWKGIPVIEAPVSVTYKPGSERVSHFRPFVDFMRNASVFTRLIIIRILIPSFIRARISWI